MPIRQWFKKRESIKSTRRRPIPGGIWSKCAVCNQVVYQKELIDNFKVCPNCNHHYQLTAWERINLLLDEDSFEEFDKNLSSKDPLNFKAKKSYIQTLEESTKLTGLSEAVVTGKGRINSRPICLAVMDFRFVGGSLGSVVGEKIVRLTEIAGRERLPLVISVASGGARMQEGVIALLQMVKTASAIGYYQQLNLPYISILTNPTTGGVSASFATLADIIIAEPGALIGFAGPRVIQETIKQKLPKGFQSAESMLDHGLIDMIVPRSKLRQTVSQLLNFLSAGGDLKIGS
jgi:acetyl-CoA carboxylase carboxyl transferase subunit beta